MNSILDSIKKLLGIPSEYNVFDDQIMMHINSVLLTLNQLGLDSAKAFSITSSDDTWMSLFGSRTDLESIKTYIYLKVRMFWDPPATSFHIQAVQEQIAELEWRLNIQLEGGA